MVHFRSENFAALFLFFQGKVTFVILLHSLVAGSLVHVGAFDFFVGGKNLILDASSASSDSSSLSSSSSSEHSDVVVQGHGLLQVLKPLANTSFEFLDAVDHHLHQRREVVGKMLHSLYFNLLS